MSLTSGNATGSGRTKVALEPGHSLLDWIRLTAANKNLSGTGGKFLTVTSQELAKHKTPKDCWLSINGRVYNVTPYISFHPGGVDEMMRGAGIDATDLFNEVHKWVNFESMLQKCLVGKLVTTYSEASANRRNTLTTANSLSVPSLVPPSLPPPGLKLPPPPRLEPASALSVPQKPLESYKCYSLQSKLQTTHDTYLFTFYPKTPEGTKKSIPVGHHVTFEIEKNSQKITRDYTPIPKALDLKREDDGCLHFMIKVYPEGPMTQYLDGLQVGQSVSISEPHRIDFDPNVRITDKKTVSLLAAGTGITPIIGLINWIFIESSLEAKVNLLFFNKTQGDILWRHEFREMETKYKDRFQVQHILSNADNQWDGEKGRIRKELLVPLTSTEPKEGHFFAVCGPNDFTLHTLRLLLDLGYDGDDQLFAFIA